MPQEKTVNVAEEARVEAFVDVLVRDGLTHMNLEKISAMVAADPLLAREALWAASSEQARRGLSCRTITNLHIELMLVMMNFFRDVGAGRRRDQIGRGLEVIDALEKAGMTIMTIWEEPLDQMLALFMRGRWDSSNNVVLDWLVRRGALSSERLARINEMDVNLCKYFAHEDDGAVAALERLVDGGWLKDEPGLPGYTDFLTTHLYRCADMLAKKGFAPRPPTLDQRFVSAGMCAAGAYLVSLGTSDLDFSKKSEVDLAVERLLWMSEHGASLSAPADSANMSLVQTMEEDPLMCLAKQRDAPSCGAKTNGHIVPLMRAMKDAGVDFSLNPHYLASEINDVIDYSGDSTYLDLALALGADPAKHPGMALAASVPRRGFIPDNSDGCSKLFDRMVALGADPKRVKARCRVEESPVAHGFEQGRFDLAWRAASAGSPMDWVSTEDGQTLLHLIAERCGKKELSELGKLLAQGSKVLALIDAKTTGADQKKSGQTALMRACAVLNVEGARRLLAAGASANLSDDRGWTALRHAGRKYGMKAKEKTWSMVRMLVEAGADPSIVDAKGVTPAQAMAAKAPLGAIAELLALRPQDLAGESEQAALTRTKIQARGAQGASMVESVVMEASVPAAAPKVRGTGKSRL